MAETFLTETNFKNWMQISESFGDSGQSLREEILRLGVEPSRDVIRRAIAIARHLEASASGSKQVVINDLIVDLELAEFEVMTPAEVDDLKDRARREHQQYKKMLDELEPFAEARARAKKIDPLDPKKIRATALAMLRKAEKFPEESWRRDWVVRWAKEMLDLAELMARRRSS